MSDHPSTGGVEGQITVATGDDVMITGTIKYTMRDCGTAFASTSHKSLQFQYLMVRTTLSA